MMRRYIHTQKELGENLRFIRENLDLTQEDLARILFIDRSTYAYYETGKTLPSIFYLIKLSETYESLNKEFANVFKKLFRGGDASLVLTDPNDILNTVF